MSHTPRATCSERGDPTAFLETTSFSLTWCQGQLCVGGRGGRSAWWGPRHGLVSCVPPSRQHWTVTAWARLISIRPDGQGPLGAVPVLTHPHYFTKMVIRPKVLNMQKNTVRHFYQVAENESAEFLTHILLEFPRGRSWNGAKQQNRNFMGVAETIPRKKCKSLTDRWLPSHHARWARSGGGQCLIWKKSKTKKTQNPMRKATL